MQQGSHEINMIRHVKKRPKLSVGLVEALVYFVQVWRSGMLIWASIDGPQVRG